MKYLKITALFGFLVFFSSCENFFEQTTTIDVPAHIPQLGVTALWIGEGNNMLVTVSSSVGVLEEENATMVSDADIVLTENGEMLVAFEESAIEEGYYHPTSPVVLTEGSTYELEVAADSYETVSAKQIMPAKATIKSAKFVKSNDKLHITITDEEREDFYLLGLLDRSGYPMDLYSENGQPDESGLNYERQIFNDETFDGQDVKLVFESNLFSSSMVDSVTVELYSVSSDYYRFDRTFSASQNADGNPFAEPVILHRNFDNGFGVFALGAKTSIFIPVE